MPAFKPRNTPRARELRNAATPAERLLWRYLARSQLGVKFSRQLPVGPYFADFLCRELCLIVELDGFSHDLRQGHDARRDAWLQANGFRLVRFTNQDVLDNVEGVVTRLSELIAASTHPQTPPASGRGVAQLSAASPPPASGRG